MTFKPLLAVPAETIEFPVYASVKIDGIRGCILPPYGLVSRKIKPIPNTFIRTLLNGITELQHHDGEILTYTNGRMDEFNLVQSKVMSEDGEPDFQYFIFDHFQFPNEAYEIRRSLIQQSRPSWRTKVVTQILVKNQEELDSLENRALADGFEGLMIRSVSGRYKYGRSTAKEGILLKVVRRQRAEAVITGTYERMENANQATLDELGYTKRSSHKDNKFGRGDLGGLDLRWDGYVDGRCIVPSNLLSSDGQIEFSCGTGFDDTTRADLWNRRDNIIGQTVTFEFRGIGSNGKPRFPTFLGFRHD